MTAKDGKPCVKCGGNEWYRRGECAPCERARKAQWKRDNREKVNENNRRWAKNNPEKMMARIYRWRKANRDAVNKANKRWQEKHRQEYRAAEAAKSSRHRTRKTAAGGSFSPSEFKALCDHYANKCLCCGRDNIKLTADHIVPVVKGGTSNIDNIQPLCGACNSSKGDKTIDYRRNGGLGRWIQRKLFG